MIQNFNNYQSHIYEERYDILKEFTGIDTVMNKVISYNKRQIVCNESMSNETFHAMHRSNPDIYLSSEERNSIKEVFKEFIPKVAEAMINELYEAGCEVDENILSELDIFNELNEGWFTKKIKQGYDSVVSGAKQVANKTQAVIDNSKEYIKDKVEKIEKSTEEVKKKIIDKYKSIIAFLQQLVEKGANSIKEFITNVAKLFEKIGGSIKEALKKLGAFNEEKDEDEAEVSVNSELLDGITDDKGETSFLKHIIAYMSIMLGDNKKKVDQMISEGFDYTLDFNNDELNEGKIMDKIANNKFIQFILCYGKGKKISWWRSLLISITGSLIITFGLPVILPILGFSPAVVPTACACVRIVWSTRSCFKIILNRYVNKKPGEKLFDTKTCLLLAIAILPQIPPFKDWIAKAFGKVLEFFGIDKWLNNIGDYLGKLIQELHGKNPSIEVIHKSWNKIIESGGGHTVFHNWEQNNAELLKHAKECGASSDKAMNALKKLVHGVSKIHGSMNIHKVYEQIIGECGDDMPHGMIVDSAKHGVNSLYNKAMQEVANTGHYPGLVSGTIGGEYWHGATHHFAGAVNICYNMSNDAKEAVAKKFVEMGGHLEDLQITEFGKGIAKHVIHKAEDTVNVNWLFNTITNSFGFVFNPSFVPFLDDKYWGKYKMRFASGTRGAAAYVVNEVKTKKGDELGDESSDALKELQSLHNSTWEKYKKRLEKTEKKAEDKENGDDKKENEIKTPDEPQYIVFYVNPNENTGDEKDKPEDNKEEKDDKPKIGVVIDPLSMMIADVCDFGKSAKIRRRPHPYFMKGLFSRLSFIPLEKNDNDTKEFIRKSLGQTMRTLILNNITYGNGIGYITCHKEGKEELVSPIDNNKENKNLQYTVSNPNFLTNEKVDAKKELIEMGNLSPEEARTCLDDHTNKEAYDLLDGKYGSRISISSKDGKTTIKAKKNDATIENIRYYEISESEYKDLYNKTNDKSLGNGKKKSSPRGIVKVVVDGKVKYYRRLSKKLISTENIKDDQKLTWAYVHIRPLLTDGRSKNVKGEIKVVDKSLPEKLKEDDDIKKLLYTDDGKLNDETFKIIDEFLYRPEKTFAKDDEHDLSKKLSKEEDENEGMFKKFIKKFKKEDKIHDTFKKMIEMIWDYLTENRRSIFKKKDNMKNHGKTNEDYEYDSLYDELICETLDDGYDDEEEYKNDIYILTERKKPIPSFSRFILERYNN